MKISHSAVRLRPVPTQVIPALDKIKIAESTRPVPWSVTQPPDDISVTGRKIYRRYAVMPPRIHALGSKRTQLEDRERVLEFFEQLLSEPGGLKARALDDALAAPKKNTARRLPAPAKPAPLNSGVEVMQLEPIV